MKWKTLLIGLFVTALVTAQLISSKLLLIPILGVAVPGGTIAYAATFFATDTMGEAYGKQQAREMVKTGFLMNFVMLSLVYLAIWIPASQGSLDPQMFETVLGSGANIVLGSLGAFLLSQFIDVEIFHYLKEYTNSKHLWFRNIASTATSQTIDTIAFTGIAFGLAPIVLGIGQPLPVAVIMSLVVGQVIVKALLALIDTPLVYIATRHIQRV